MRLGYLCAPYYSRDKLKYSSYGDLIQKLGDWVGETQECVPITPYMLLTQFGEVWDDWPKYSDAIMDKCDVMFIYSGHGKETEAMREEIEYWNYALHRHNTMHYVFECEKCGKLTLEDDFAECGNGACPDCCEKCKTPRECQYADEENTE